MLPNLKYKQNIKFAQRILTQLATFKNHSCEYKNHNHHL